MLKKIQIIVIYVLVGITSVNAQTWTEKGTAPANTHKIKLGLNRYMYYLTTGTNNLLYSTILDVNNYNYVLGQGILTSVAISANNTFGIGGNGTQIYELKNNNTWVLDNTGNLVFIDCSDEKIATRGASTQAVLGLICQPCLLIKLILELTKPLLLLIIRQVIF
jgi:hypothetical protein